MPNQDGVEAESPAQDSWRTGRPSRWRATSDARLRQQEGISKPGDAEPDVIEEFLRERVGLLDVLFDDREDD